jgi:pseudouridine-5'-phosphate glycosidase
MNLSGGQLVGNPIPFDDEIPAEILGPHVDAALRSAKASDIIGKDVTPYLLDQVLSLTNGRSLEANVALIKNNAALAAEIADHLAVLR